MLKKIKQKILLVKIAGILFALVFISHLGLTIYQSIQIIELQRIVQDIKQ